MSLNVILGGSTHPELKRVSGILLKSASRMVITAVFRTLRESREVLDKHPSPDLLLLDTDLSDGKSFEILKGDKQDIPVIFFSSSSADAVRAFSANAIDYLIKPLRPAALARAIDKFSRLRRASEKHVHVGAADPPARHYRQRIIIRNGNRFQFRTVSEVALFYAEGKSVYLVTRHGGRKFLIDHTLEELEASLHPDAFFRISRKHIVSADCIAEVKGLISGKLAVKLNVGGDQELSVSRGRAAVFKRWLDQ